MKNQSAAVPQGAAASRFSLARYTRSAVGLTILSIAICHMYIYLR